MWYKKCKKVRIFFLGEVKKIEGKFEWFAKLTPVNYVKGTASNSPS
jgi:hypothetical protein